MNEFQFSLNKGIPHILLRMCQNGEARTWFANSLSVVKLSSYKGRTVDALGQRADEGRGKRRYAGGSCNRAMIPGFPNGVTRHLLNHVALPPEYIGWIEGSRGTETSKYPDE